MTKDQAIIYEAEWMTLFCANGYTSKKQIWCFLALAPVLFYNLFHIKNTGQRLQKKKNELCFIIIALKIQE